MCETTRTNKAMHSFWEKAWLLVALERVLSQLHSGQYAIISTAFYFSTPRKLAVLNFLDLGRQVDSDTSQQDNKKYKRGRRRPCLMKSSPARARCGREVVLEGAFWRAGHTSCKSQSKGRWLLEERKNVDVDEIFGCQDRRRTVVSACPGLKENTMASTSLNKYMF